MKKYLIRLFRLKGSFSWALKEMKKGKIVSFRACSGTVCFRFSRDKQDRIEWTFNKKVDNTKYTDWANANMFYHDILRVDWYSFWLRK